MFCFRKTQKIKSLPDPFLRIEQEQWMELFKEKKNQLQNIVMEIDAWRSRYPKRVALVMGSKAYQYFIDKGIPPPPTPAFEEAECHKAQCLKIIQKSPSLSHLTTLRAKRPL